MSARKPDRYRRVRKALRHVRRYRMKGKAAATFVDRVKTSCFVKAATS